MEIEKLIEEVRKRPILYDTSLSTYTRYLKPQLWLEVATAVVPDWESISPAEQQTRVIEIQRRWRTLRDNFKRELKYQKSVEYGGVATKRRKYKHYDTLSFLEPVMERKGVNGENGMFHYGMEMFMANDMVTFEDSYPSFEDRTGVKMEEGEEYNGEESHKLLPEVYSPYYDPDEMFFLSLIPAFKRLSEEQKSLARVKLAQLMHDLVYSSNESAASSTTTSP